MYATVAVWSTSNPPPCCTSWICACKFCAATCEPTLSANDSTADETFCSLTVGGAISNLAKLGAVFDKNWPILCPAPNASSKEVSKL